MPGNVTGNVRDSVHIYQRAYQRAYLAEGWVAEEQGKKRVSQQPARQHIRLCRAATGWFQMNLAAG